jgi:protein SCO1
MARSVARERYLACLILALLGLSGCTLKSSLPEMGQVGRFHLISQSGEPYASDSLKGKVWIADFIFTTCQGPCPRMTARMRKLQAEYWDVKDVQLISFTVDPANDTPPALDAYARQFGADPERWRFLTGSEADLRKLSHDTFHVSGGGPGPEHSTHFILVDRKARIRGYYDSSDADALKQLSADVERVRREVL